MSDLPLRERARQRVVRRDSVHSKMSTERALLLAYELEIHQEELSIQNEELQRAQLDLRKARDRFANLYEFAPVGYLTLDADGNVLEANLNAAKLLDKVQSKLIGARFAFFIDENSRLEFHNHLQQLTLENSRKNCELMLKTSSGRDRRVRLESRAVDDKGTMGKSSSGVQYWIALSDVTEQHAAVQAVLEKDRHIRAMADALPVLIAYLGPNLHFRFANEVHYEWFGRLPDSARPKTLKEIFGQEFAHEHATHFEEAIKGHPTEFESTLEHRERGTRQIQMMLIPDVDENGICRGVHTLGLDITERKYVEAQNARRRQYAEKLDRLTMNEREVLERLVHGKANKKIAFEMDIGLRTVERRRKNILRKFGVESVAELLAEMADIQEVTTSKKSL